MARVPERAARPQVVLCDLDDTLMLFSDVDRQSWRRAIASLPETAELASDGLVAAFYQSATTFWADPAKNDWGRVNPEAARSEIARAALEGRLDPRPELCLRLARAYWEDRKRAFRLFPRVKETLCVLQAAGYRLGMVTNGDSRGQREKIARFGLGPHFEHVLIEEEVGSGKPAPEIFLRAAAAFSLPPADIWMTGNDLERDVAGAKAVGMTGVWVNPASSPPFDGDVVPDHVIGAFHEIASLLCVA